MLRNDSQNSLKNSSPILKDFNSFQDANKKSPGIAIIYSLLLPGMGELYAGSYSSGKYFTIAEGALWASYIGFNSYGNWQKDNYKSFAVSNGGITEANKNDDYYANIGLYSSVNEFNDAKALDRNFAEMYDTQKYYWNWNGDDRKAYRGMWLASEHSFNNIRFVVGAMIVNRIISAINAVRLVSKYNKNLEENLGWNLSVGVSNELSVPTHLTLNFETQF